MHKIAMYNINVYLLKQRRDVYRLKAMTEFEFIVPGVADCSTNGSNLVQKMTGMQQTLLVAHIKKDDTRVLHDVLE